ncbi:MAG: hypothetical protein QGH42_11515 [Kiritimatiellia bacterium]|nr:hypothetical protein [Kiritimatiellia bacterium]MDP6810080.1 hypothetical protein [Kiritimatiellia bacterium]MDP7024851.1 hypothetical protein [Kiritimatiellia bacterium]
MKKRYLNLVLLLAVVLGAVLAHDAVGAGTSTTLPIAGYVYRQHFPTSPDARDKERTALADGKINPGPWAYGGWAGVLREGGSPLTIRFNLGTWYLVDRVTLHYLHKPSDGITAPSRVEFAVGAPGHEMGEAQSFRDIAVTKTPLQSVTIPLTQTAGQYVELTIFNWRGGWTFLSEVSFKGRKSLTGEREGR